MTYIGAPYQRGSATSLLAAEEAALKAEAARQRIIMYLAWAGYDGATRDELARELHLPIQTVCARVDELLKSGRVFRTDRVRKTTAGRDAEIIIII